ncbi:MAG TPA: hypothetical protein VIT45_08790 [Allosphingosinicella sp.]
MNDLSTATAPGSRQDAIASVRPQVREMLTRIPAFSGLEPEEQREMAHNMVKILAYLSDPGGLVSEARQAEEGQAAKAAPALARAQASNAVEATKQNLSASPGVVGKDFVGGAAREGVEQFGALVQKVDFPQFVGGLIDNVFKSIVETSIAQMRAYGELVANVAKSAADYMNENIGMGAGRDYLVDRFPDLLDVQHDDGRDGEAGSSRLTFKGEDEESGLAEIAGSLGFEGDLSDLSDENQELLLVNHARMQMARSKQQLLASMVMLGINRIVITDGSITAKVQFDMRSTDTAKRDYRAAMFDKQTSRNKNTSAAGFHFPGFGGGSVNVNERSHVATVSTGLDETSESKLDMKAKLAGEVRVNFKSDYLPLEKMATPAMIGAIQGNSQPVEPRNLARPAPVPGAPAPAAAPTAPPAGAVA